MPTTAALIWHLIVAGPQGGLVVLPGSFETREQCSAAITEYKKQPTPSGWAIECVPDASLYGDDLGTDDGEAEMPQ